MSSSRERQLSISSYFATSELQNSQRNEQVDLTEDSELRQHEPELNEPPPNIASLAHHRASGFNLSWQKGRPWLVHNKEPGMFCTLCKQFNKIPRNGSGVWVSMGCKSFRNDKVKAHEQCASHKETEKDRAAKAASESSGGIRAALQEAMSQERRAVIGALKCMYFLTNNELPHTTTFSELLDLAIDLGSDYLQALRQAGNAHYRSEQIMYEYVQCLSKCIQENVISDMLQSDNISLTVYAKTTGCTYSLPENWNLYSTYGR